MTAQRQLDDLHLDFACMYVWMYVNRTYVQLGIGKCFSLGTSKYLELVQMVQLGRHGKHPSTECNAGGFNDKKPP